MTFSLRTAWTTAVVATLLGSTACGDDTSIEPVPPAPVPAVIVRHDAADASFCTYGGSVIRSGSDRSGDGVLQDDEIVASTPVCLPAPPVIDPPPPPAAVLIDEQPAPITLCPTGGTVVRSGPDRNGNHVLDPDEVAGTAVVCNDAVLTRMDAEPAGAHCRDGGLAFHVGHDLDFDRVLADDEIESTSYECSDVISRTVVVTTAADLAALAEVRVITGGLIIDRTALTEVALPKLELIGGRLSVVDNQQLRRVSMPALVAIDGYLDVSLDAVLTELALPALTRVVGDLNVASNPLLPDLSGLANLVMVGFNLSIHDNAVLSAVPTRLARIGGLVLISANPALAQLDLTVADSLGRVLVSNNARLTTVTLAARPMVGVTSSIASISITSNPALGLVRLQAATIEQFRIDGNDKLGEFRVLANRVRGDAFVESAALNVAWLERHDFSDQLAIVIDGTLTISGPATMIFAGWVGAEVGALTVRGTRAQDLHYRFAVIDGDVSIEDNSLMTTLSFRSIGGDLRITGNPLLTYFWIIDHDILHGDVEIRDNAALQSPVGIQPVATILGSLTLSDNPAMVRTGLYGLRHVGGEVHLSGLPALTALDMQDLASIGGGVAIVNTGLSTWNDDATGWPGLGALEHAGTVRIEGNPALRDIDLPRLKWAGHVWIADNPALNELGFAALESATSLNILDNSALPLCAVSELFARVDSDSEHQSGNDDDGVCN